MKNFSLMTFMSGILSGIIIFTLFSFTSSNSIKSIFSLDFDSITENNKKVKPGDALTYRQNYESINPDKVKGINLSLQQWSAINKTVEDRNYDISQLSGFRVYFGLKSADQNAEKVSVVYTLDKQKKVNEPQQAQMMQMAVGTEENFHQQCPPYCD